VHGVDGVHGDAGAATDDDDDNDDDDGVDVGGDGD